MVLPKTGSVSKDRVDTNSSEGMEFLMMLLGLKLDICKEKLHELKALINFCAGVNGLIQKT